MQFKGKVSGMGTNTISVDVLTSSYRLKGDLKRSHSGVMSILNDPTSSFIELQDVSMGRIVAGDNLTQTISVAQVLKNQIMAICFDHREDLMLQPLTRGTYLRPVRYLISVTTPVYEIEGIYEWNGRLDLAVIMRKDGSSFVPLYDASLGAIFFPNLLIQSPVLLFNRDFLSTLIRIDEG
jgi:hypothetical protein